MERYIPKRHAREVALNARHPFLSFRNEIDDLFSSWLTSPSDVSQQVKSVSFVPKLDVVEDDEKYLVSAELPGLGEDDIDIFGFEEFADETEIAALPGPFTTLDGNKSASVSHCFSS